MHLLRNNFLSPAPKRVLPSLATSVLALKYPSQKAWVRPPTQGSTRFLFGISTNTSMESRKELAEDVIHLDRPDAGYSPLWQVFWGTELPIDYSANEASNNGAMSSANGFEFFVAPMSVNCPNIGLVDKGALNEDTIMSSN
jgi:hypothetical protein